MQNHSQLPSSVGSQEDGAFTGLTVSYSYRLQEEQKIR